jgi:hypothetical protein
MTIALAGWIFVLSLSLGSFILSKFHGAFGNHLEKLSFGFALGFGLLGYIVLAIGLSGFLYPWVLWILLGVLSALLIQEEIFWLRSFIQSLRSLADLRKENALTFYFTLASCLIFFLALLQAFLPSTAHDALCYHLYIPKRFVQEHRIQYFPYLVNSLFPFLIEMHYTLALLFGRPELANLFHFFTGLGTFLGVIALGRRLGNAFIGLTAGLIFISAPGIFNQMIIAYNDVGLAFFTFFTFYAFLKAVDDNEGIMWFILMGIFSGFALSVKYLALFHVIVISALSPFALTLSRSGGKDNGDRVRKYFLGLLLYFAFTLIFSFIWYLRSYVHEGNPVYPFFPEIFGGTGKEYDFGRAGFGKGWLDLVLVPWRLTLFPQKFGGSWAQLGLCYLTFLPLVFLLKFEAHSKNVILRPKAEESRSGSFAERVLSCRSAQDDDEGLGMAGLLLAGFSLLYFLFWFYTVQNLRFLFPLLPILSILIAFAARHFLVWLVLLLCLNTGFALYHGKNGYAYLLGRENRSTYLLRDEKTYRLAQWLNQNLPKEAKVLNTEEVRMFYFEPEMVREREFRKKTRYHEIAQTPAGVLEVLENAGISHILFVVHEETDPESAPPLSVRKLILNQDFKNRYLELLYDEAAGKENYEIYNIRYPKSE